MNTVVDIPHDLDAERGVLAAVMNSRALGYVTRHLSADDFYRPAHGTILAAAQALAERGVEVDPITLAHELTKRGELIQVGGGPYLHDIMSTLTAGSVTEHVSIVAEHATRRRLYEAGQRVMQLARQASDDLTDVLDRARAAVDTADTAWRDRSGAGGVDLGDLLARRFEQYDDPTPPGVSTGWPDLDRWLGGGTGLHPGRLCVIAARPGVGKSMVGVAVAVAAAERRVRSLLASLEMPDDEVADRIFASHARVKLDHLQAHKLSDEERTRVGLALARLRSAPARVDDSPSMSLSRLRSIARDMTRQDPPLGLIVADYLQLMKPADSKVAREQQVSAMSRGLKLMAKEFHVPVIALAQLNRDVERRQDKKPLLSDLRESGSVEQDADVVLLLAIGENGSEIDVHIAKNRGGKSGEVVKLAWAPSLARVSSLAHHQEPA